MNLCEFARSCDKYVKLRREEEGKTSITPRLTQLLTGLDMGKATKDNGLPCYDPGCESNECYKKAQAAKRNPSKRRNIMGLPEGIGGAL